MKRYNAGISGTNESLNIDINSLGLDPLWTKFISVATKGHSLRPVQVSAIRDAQLFQSRRNMVVSAPTNSGKSLIGHLALAEAVSAGHRAILLEPLRALAQEKARDLRELWNTTGWSPIPHVILTTGDYRLEHQSFEETPSDAGEVVVATPERLDALLRNPKHSEWFERVGCVVVDEAHLLGTSHRGPTLELVIAQLRSLTKPPRIILLSATIGKPENLQKWLNPCDLVEVTERTPSLVTEVCGLDVIDQADEIVISEVLSALEDSAARVLVFTYRRQSTKSLATKLTKAGPHLAKAYHSGMSSIERAEVRGSFEHGDVRVVVATTALALGVNLPATHVIVRDTTFHGFGRLEVDDLLQMTGRAGRGSNSGWAIVLVKPTDVWDPSSLATAIQTRQIPPLQSIFARSTKSRESIQYVETAAQLIASCLARAGEGGMSKLQLQALLGKTMAGDILVSHMSQSLKWLNDPTRLISYESEEGKLHLTTLGIKGVRSVLPLKFVSGFGTLVRDLLWLDGTDKLLSQWSTLDHLLVLGLLNDRTPSVRRFSEKLAGQLDGWHEKRAQRDKSMIFREWISGVEGKSKADELLGSLGRYDIKDARKVGYTAMIGTVLLDERARGTSTLNLEKQWQVENLSGIEESWRDTVLWLLAGQARLCDLRCFYHHLIEYCDADQDRIQRVKPLFRRMRHQIFDVMESIKYCSPLGPLVRGVRGMLQNSKQATVGAGTIRRLEDAGLCSLADVGALNIDDLVALGVQRRFAKQIRTYLRRRLR